MIYMGFEAFKRKFKLWVGHEASLVMLIGFCVSYIFLKTKAENFQEQVQFNDVIFFYICLPPIIFAKGFNMHRKNLTANIKNIMLFGVVGTFLSFALFCIITYVYVSVIKGN